MEIFIALCLVAALLVLITTSTEGTKGITNEYTSKSGRTRTAKKSREEHIV
jgi:hypothetical protein|tara:strand:- start:1390 stop:1542 length:153 start_codon:yes stop_codon:yes gene_type:complete